MDDLAQWLTAQLDEDERIARAAMSGIWQARTLPGNIEHVHPAFWVDAEYTDGEGVTNATVADCQWSLADAQHIAEHDPARVLREIDGKRKQLAECVRAMDYDSRGTPSMAKDFMVLLALPFSHRPGYAEAIASL